jgi:hypothetical protein
MAARSPTPRLSRFTIEAGIARLVDAVADVVFGVGTAAGTGAAAGELHAAIADAFGFGIGTFSMG